MWPTLRFHGRDPLDCSCCFGIIFYLWATCYPQAKHFASTNSLNLIISTLQMRILSSLGWLAQVTPGLSRVQTHICLSAEPPQPGGGGGARLGVLKSSGIKMCNVSMEYLFRRKSKAVQKAIMNKILNFKQRRNLIRTCTSSFSCLPSLPAPPLVLGVDDCFPCVRDSETVSARVPQLLLRARPSEGLSA